MSRKRTDFRALQARRAAALHSHAQHMTTAAKPAPVPAVDIAAAVAAGKLQRIPERRRSR